MRKIRPTRASAELGPGTARRDPTHAPKCRGQHTTPASRTNPLFDATFVFCTPFLDTSCIPRPTHANPSRASAHFRPRRRGWSTPRRVHLAHARPVEMSCLGAPAALTGSLSPSSSSRSWSFLSNFRSSTPAIANDVRHADASRSVPPARPKPAVSATAPAQQSLAAASREPSRASHNAVCPSTTPAHDRFRKRGDRDRMARMARAFSRSVQL